MQSGAAGERGDAGLSARAISARHVATAERRRTEWLAVGLPRNSSHLFAQLPFADAVRLAALVGTGRMTWPAVNAALDAMIKLAAADDLDGQRAVRCMPVRQVAEDEIRARYHAQCDELFVKNAGAEDADAPSREELWGTEQILDRIRNARDREFAALRRRIYAQPAIPWTELAPAESAALDKLDRTGFFASEEMIESIASLVAEIAASG